MGERRLGSIQYLVLTRVRRLEEQIDASVDRKGPANHDVDNARNVHGAVGAAPEDGPVDVEGRIAYDGQGLDD